MAPQLFHQADLQARLAGEEEDLADLSPAEMVSMSEWALGRPQ